MKKRMIVAFLLLTAVAYAKSTIKFKNTTVDFGEVSSGKTIDIVFEFENAGNEVLLIKNIIPSCGCTTAALAKKEYQPGEKGTIVSKFNTSGYNGKIIKTITVSSNDGDAAETRLTLTGTVIVKDFAQAELRPDRIAFGAVAIGKSYVRKLSLGNVGSIDLRILEVSSAPEVSLAFKTNSVGARKTSDITLTFTPFEKGAFNTIVKIRSNDLRNPYIFVRLEAQVD